MDTPIGGCLLTKWLCERETTSGIEGEVVTSSTAINGQEIIHMNKDHLSVRPKILSTSTNKQNTMTPDLDFQNILMKPSETTINKSTSSVQMNTTVHSTKTNDTSLSDSSYATAPSTPAHFSNINNIGKSSKSLGDENSNATKQEFKANIPFNLKEISSSEENAHQEAGFSVSNDIYYMHEFSNPLPNYKDPKTNPMDDSHDKEKSTYYEENATENRKPIFTKAAIDAQANNPGDPFQALQNEVRKKIITNISKDIPVKPEQKFTTSLHAEIETKVQSKECSENIQNLLPGFIKPEDSVEHSQSTLSKMPRQYQSNLDLSFKFQQQIKHSTPRNKKFRQSKVLSRSNESVLQMFDPMAIDRDFEEENDYSCKTEESYLPDDANESNMINNPIYDMTLPKNQIENNLNKSVDCKLDSRKQVMEDKHDNVPINSEENATDKHSDEDIYMESDKPEPPPVPKNKPTYPPSLSKEPEECYWPDDEANERNLMSNPIYEMTPPKNQTENNLNKSVDCKLDSRKQVMEDKHDNGPINSEEKATDKHSDEDIYMVADKPEPPPVPKHKPTSPPSLSKEPSKLSLYPQLSEIEKLRNRPLPVIPPLSKHHAVKAGTTQNNEGVEKSKDVKAKENNFGRGSDMRKSVTSESNTSKEYGLKISSKQRSLSITEVIDKGDKVDVGRSSFYKTSSVSSRIALLFYLIHVFSNIVFLQYINFFEIY